MMLIVLLILVLSVISILYQYKILKKWNLEIRVLKVIVEKK
ncbi:hypothetical protein [Clostridium akagii]|nr:hypothetical protein [Clostridium akagii]